MQQYLQNAMRDPDNNLKELDNNLEEMLKNKIFSPHRPSLGLIYESPATAHEILTSHQFIHLFFHSRVFHKQHQWDTQFLSPISRLLIRKNLFDKLPSIYTKSGREIDIQKTSILLTTCDYFFMSFIVYPIIIGPEIPRLLNQIYTSKRWKHQKETNDDDLTKFKIPNNPFKMINNVYSYIFKHYLDTFLPRFPYYQYYSNQYHQNQPQIHYASYNIKFIEIVGELWFGQKFEKHPIGDRCHTLPLMQDLLFRIMEKQINYQRQIASKFQFNTKKNIINQESYSYNFDNQSLMTVNNDNNINTNTLFGGKLPKTSCLCPELRALKKYLYFFFRESFEHFPLDFITHLKNIMEMYLYILAPWTISYKFNNPDTAIRNQKMNDKIRWQQKQQSLKNKQNGYISSMWQSLINSNSTKSQNQQEDMMYDLKYNFIKWNDDRERITAFNNTQFKEADGLIDYELGGMDQAFDIKIWRQYIIEMLPFYTTLTNYFIDSCLKYQFNHPLLQLPVLKIFHLYKNEEIINILSKCENILINPFQNMIQNNYNNTFDQNTMINSEPYYIADIFQQTTFLEARDYKCLPFDLYDTIQNNDRYNNKYQQQIHGVDIQRMIKFKQITHNKAHQLYIKCRKAMERLCPTKYRQQQEPMMDYNVNNENKIIVNSGYLSSWFSSWQQQKQLPQHRQNQKREIRYFMTREDNVKMIRYISGELEALFNINNQQRESLMNMSIMYEPSNSMTPTMWNNKHKSRREMDDESKSATLNVDSLSKKIWNKPYGEWEFKWIVDLNKYLVFNCIVPYQCVDDIYSRWLASFHRSILIDIRVLLWMFVLFVSYYFSSLLFILTCFLLGISILLFCFPNLIRDYV